MAAYFMIYRDTLLKQFWSLDRDNNSNNNSNNTEKRCNTSIKNFKARLETKPCHTYVGCGGDFPWKN